MLCCEPPLPPSMSLCGIGRCHGFAGLLVGGQLVFYCCGWLLSVADYYCMWLASSVGCGVWLLLLPATVAGHCLLLATVYGWPRPIGYCGWPLHIAGYTVAGHCLLPAIVAATASCWLLWLATPIAGYCGWSLPIAGYCGCLLLLAIVAGHCLLLAAVGGCRYYVLCSAASAGHFRLLAAAAALRLSVVVHCRPLLLWLLEFVASDCCGLLF